jgi:hypothetical protein
VTVACAATSAVRSKCLTSCRIRSHRRWQASVHTAKPSCRFLRSQACTQERLFPARMLPRTSPMLWREGKTSFGPPFYRNRHRLHSLHEQFSMFRLYRCCSSAELSRHLNLGNEGIGRGMVFFRPPGPNFETCRPDACRNIVREISDSCVCFFGLMCSASEEQARPGRPGLSGVSSPSRLVPPLKREPPFWACRPPMLPW